MGKYESLSHTKWICKYQCRLVAYERQSRAEDASERAKATLLAPAK